MNFIKVFPAVTTSTDFAVLGYETTSSIASAITGSGFAVRYDAPTQSYVIDLPSYPAGGFHSFDENSRFWNGSLENPAAPGTLQPVDVSIFKPTATNPDAQFTYTTFGQYNFFGKPVGAFAFGIATPMASMPISGTASYTAYVTGSTANSVYYVRGSAVLNFDFGASTLSGQFDPLLVDLGGGSRSLGTYSFHNTVVSGNTFSGSMTRSWSVPLNGTFNGMFTGPNAQELMARWQAQYFLLGEMTRPDTMFGVWVGKKP